MLLSLLAQIHVFPLPAGFSKTVIWAVKFCQLNKRSIQKTMSFDHSGIDTLRLIFIIVKQGAEWISKVNLVLTQTFADDLESGHAV